MPSYVVTGAARGIGFGYLEKLSSDPANTVIGLVRNITTGAKDALKLAETNKNVHIIQADISDNKALVAAAAEVSKITGGSLDVLINNAGLIENGFNNLAVDEYPTPEAFSKELHKFIDVNVLGVAHTIRAFIPLVKKGSVKKVISISSGMGDVDFINKSGITTSVSYAISKGALNVAIAKYAAQYKPDGIIFLALCPGNVKTGAINVDNLSPNEVEAVEKAMKKMLELYPHFKGPMTVADSVNKQLEVINKWTLEQSGAFVSHKGNREWL